MKMSRILITAMFIGSMPISATAAVARTQDAPRESREIVEQPAEDAQNAQNNERGDGAGPFSAQPTAKPLSLSFEGGSAQEFIQALRSQSPTANIIVFGELAGLRIPEMHLRDVYLIQAMELLDNRRWIHDGRRYATEVRAIHRFGPNRAAMAHDPTTIYEVTVESRQINDVQNEEDEQQTRSHIMAVGDLVGEDGNADDLLSAVETALELQDSASEDTRIRYHRDTRLLMVRGPMRALDTIVSVVNEFREQREMARDLEHARVLEEAGRVPASTLENIRDEHERLKHELSKAQNRAIELDVRNSALHGEIERLQVALDQSEDRNRQLVRELEKLRVHLERMQQERADPTDRQ